MILRLPNCEKNIHFLVNMYDRNMGFELIFIWTFNFDWSQFSYPSGYNDA